MGEREDALRKAAQSQWARLKEKIFKKAVQALAITMEASAPIKAAAPKGRENTER